MTRPPQYLQIEDRDHVSWVTIKRLEDRNSIHSPLMDELISLLDRVEGTETRALVFTGAGSTYFIGGADGVEMMQLTPAEAEDFSWRIQRLFNRMEASPLILVAAINGICFGGGFEFALACDLRVAVTTARIGLPEVKVGLIPGGGGTQRLPRLVGIGRAIQMILSGHLYKGEEAAALGLVHLTVEPEDLRKGVERILSPILRQPSHAVSLAKGAVYAACRGAMEHGLKVETEQFGRCFHHGFFRDLMGQQLREGVLQTTADLSGLMKEK